MEHEGELKVLREPDAMDTVGVRSKQHFRQLISAGLMPRPIRIGRNSVGWLAHELQAVLRARMAERDATHATSPPPIQSDSAVAA
jgi:predicted DNA-binding transcriptional regulator AlpA